MILQKNQWFLLTTAGLIHALRQQGVDPIFWKGVVLADSFYPNIGARPMDDIDMAIPPETTEIVKSVFATLGWQYQPQKTTRDAIYFSNDLGLACDVHHHVEIFRGKESFNLSMQLKPRVIRSTTIHVLEPNAMVALLAAHMDGHRPDTGPILIWIVDLAFVLAKWGHLLDLDHLEYLLPKPHFPFFYRAIQFLQVEWGLHLPSLIAERARSFLPLTLTEILRQRRLTPWRLSSLRGWLKLIAYRMHFKPLDPSQGLQLPDGTDFLLWPSDLLRDRSMKAKAATIKMEIR
jgi:hypothetical protein